MAGFGVATEVYAQGFYTGCEWSGAELARLSEEIRRLEHYWDQLALPKEVLNGLHEIATGFYEAINAAKNCNGVLLIT
jgi:hypothetical protein